MPDDLPDPFAFTDGIAWHKPAHRSVMASVRLGSWMSAALDDPNTCEAMKADIREWFSAGEPMEVLGQALAHYRIEASRPDEVVQIVAWLQKQSSTGQFFADAIERGDHRREGHG